MEAGPGEAAPGEHGGGAGRRQAPGAALRAAPPRPASPRDAAPSPSISARGSRARWCRPSPHAGYDAGQRQAGDRAGRGLATLLLRAVREQAGVLPGDVRRDRRPAPRGVERGVHAGDRRAGGAAGRGARGLRRQRRSATADAAPLVLLEAPRARRPRHARMRAAAAACEAALGAALAGTRADALACAARPCRGCSADCMGSLSARFAVRAAGTRDARKSGSAGGCSHRGCRPARRGSALERDAARRQPARRCRRRDADGSGATPRGDRERLLAAALRLAAREPVPLLSAAQIADEAGLPLEAFFELFDDREAMPSRRARATRASSCSRSRAAPSDRDPEALRATLVGAALPPGRQPAAGAGDRRCSRPAPASAAAAYGRELERELARRARRRAARTDERWPARRSAERSGT